MHSKVGKANVGGKHKLVAWGLITLLIAARIPQLRLLAEAAITTSPSTEINELDPRLLELAINTSLTVSVILASGLFAIYQSIGTVLEQKFSVNASRQGHSLPRSAFFWTSFTAAAVTHAVCIVFDRASLRDVPLWYVLLLLIGLSAGWLTQRTEGGNPSSRNRLPYLLATSLFGLMSALM